MRLSLTPPIGPTGFRGGCGHVSPYGLGLRPPLEAVGTKFAKPNIGNPPTTTK